MNVILKIFLLGSLSLLAGCQQKSGEGHDHNGHDHETHAEGLDHGNQALFDEVMQVHDEVMPKMNDLYKAKTALQNKIASTPGMGENEKKQINIKIARLDSAGEGMMVWMRQFSPIPDDSLGEDVARKYLESEMVKVRKVKENILAALQDTDPKN